MTEIINEKKRFPKKLLVLALVILTNPVVNIFDYLPDFFGYLIIFITLGYFADRVPYFEEAKVAFRNLTILGGVKIPAYFVMAYIRSHNYSDNDVKALFAFSFAVFEVVLLISAVRKIFTALSYLGQRSDAASLISPFMISKKGRMATPDGLKIFCHFFVIYKAAFTALPEMLLLTRGVSGEDYGRVFNVARLYPYTILFSIISILVLGIILTKRFSRFFSAIHSEGLIYSAADSLISTEGGNVLDRKLQLKRILTSLYILGASVIFAFDLRFDNLSQIDILPDFLFGVLLVVGVHKINKQTTKSLGALISAAIYTVVSTVSYIIESSFLDKYGYDMLPTSKIAKAAYVPVIASSAARLAALAVAFIFIAILLCRFVSDNIGLDAHDKRYSSYDAAQHKKMHGKIYVFSALGVALGIARLLECIFRYPSKIIYVSTDVGSATIAMGIAPWFGVVSTVCSIIFIAFTLYLFANIKEEVELKYS